MPSAKSIASEPVHLGVIVIASAAPSRSASRFSRPWAATPCDTGPVVPPDSDRTAEPIDLAAGLFPRFRASGFNIRLTVATLSNWVGPDPRLVRVRCQLVRKGAQNSARKLLGCVRARLAPCTSSGTARRSHVLFFLDCGVSGMTMTV